MNQDESDLGSADSQPPSTLGGLRAHIDKTYRIA